MLIYKDLLDASTWYWVARKVSKFRGEGRTLQPARTWPSTSTEALVCVYEQTDLRGN